MISSLILSFCLCVPTVIGTEFTSPHVVLGNTTITGQTSTLTPNVETFRGIPYAIPPVNQHRLRPPIPMMSLHGDSFNASSFGFSCPQMRLPFFTPPNELGEDCLSLNIYRPADLHRQARIPVLVVIPGGAFITGGSAQYDASLMVNRSMARGTPMMVVTFNYRLGPLGFPQGEELAAQGALNLGLKDQLVALQWVHRNIRFFGGDPRKVTVLGESAGASAIWYHMFGFEMGHLVRAAICQSMAGSSLVETNQGTEEWAKWVETIPACKDLKSTLDCLRSLPQDSPDILDAILLGASQRWGPSVDARDSVIPEFTSRRSKMASRMPLLLGSNLDEYTIFTPQDVDSDEFINSTLRFMGSPPPEGEVALESLIANVLDAYPDDPSFGSPYGTGNDTFGLDKVYKRAASILGDVFFQAPTRTSAGIVRRTGLPTFLYHFTASGLFPLLPDYAPGSLGVPHAADLIALTLLGPLSLFDITDPDVLAFSTVMQDYWISFVTRLNPNDGFGVANRPTWDVYDERKPFHLQLDKDGLKMVPADFRAKEISLINENPVLLRR